MAKLAVSLGCCAYDRTRALFDGRVGIDGCEVLASPVEPEEAFHRAFKFQDFDISELSFNSYLMTLSRGENRYVAIPVFVSRIFRHSGIYVRTDRGIATPRDLAGRTIGVPGYQITANTWIRGILEDDYGVRPSDIRWRIGNLEEPGENRLLPFALPAGVEHDEIPSHRTLSEMLESGEIDGIMGARAPSCFERGAPGVGRLFPDHRAVEEDYFRRTGIFPIMHLIGIRKSLVERHPWLPVNVFKAFQHAKDLCMAELGQLGHLYTTLPWGWSEFQRTRALMGDDYWSYGIDANRHVVETLARYSFTQGLSARRLAVEEIFAPSTLDLSRV